MSAITIAEPITQAARPSVKANIAGILYLANMMAFVPAAYIHSRFVIPSGTVPGALVTAPLYRFSFTFDLIAVVSGIAVTVLFFDLFKPVSHRLSLSAAYAGFMGCAITAASCILHFVPMAILRAADYFPVFAMKLDPLALLFLRMRIQTANIGIVFAGVYCLLIARLIFQSGFLPKSLGVLMAVAALGWLTYLSPTLANHLAPVNSLVSGLIGEGSLVLWLMIKGVTTRIHWRDRT